MLTELGKAFVHYAMMDLPPKIEFSQMNKLGEMGWFRNMVGDTR